MKINTYLEPLDIYTSTLKYRGEDRLDVTVKSQDPVGKYFAPTWDMVMASKSKRIGFLDYEELYYTLVRHRLDTDRRATAAVEDVLKRKTVTFVCYCKDFTKCHRTLLGWLFFNDFAATFKGERQ